MPVLRFDVDQLNRLAGGHWTAEEIADRLPMIGGDLDGVEGSQVAIEFFPNRPDLLSVEGVARSARAFFGVRPGLVSYPVEPGSEVVRIDAAVAQVRPFIAFARVDGVPMDADMLTRLLELQERLTLGLGRRRKKVAIGIHDASQVKAPFTYRAVAPDSVSFIPLGKESAMTASQVLRVHEKGRLYAHLVDSEGLVPMIEDADGHVLSFPPIINGVRTQLTPDTRRMLVDVTGTDRAAVYGTLNIVVTALAEAGGTIKSLRHVAADSSWHAPDLAPTRWVVSKAMIERILGLQLSDDTLDQCLQRMGHAVAGIEGDGVLVDVGAWRVDLIHPIDLVEDVAVGYGYDRFDAALPQHAMFGSQRPASRVAARARTSLLGQGYSEVLTLTLTGVRDQYEFQGVDSASAVTVANPVTKEQAILRDRLVPNLLAILRANKGNPLPQAVFEVGAVVPSSESQPSNRLHAAAVRMSSRASFSSAKAMAQAFCRDIGIEADVSAGDVPGLAVGRTALLTVDGQRIGSFGEVDPATLAAFELEAPALAFEVLLDSAPSMM